MFMSPGSTTEEINFTVAIITFLIIFMFTGIMSYKFGLVSPASISFIVFGLVYFFDYAIPGTSLLDKATSGAGIPSHSLTFLAGLIFLVLLIREVTSK